MTRKIHQQYSNNAGSTPKEDYLTRFGELHDPKISDKGTVGKYWGIIKLGRWVITLLIMVFLRDYYALQIMCLLFISFMVCALVVGA